MIVKKRCSHAGCRELIEASQTYCESHKGSVDREYNKWRNEAQAEYIAFYKSSAWQKKRKQALKRDQYLCQHCLAEDIYYPADLVDHIQETRDYWELRLDLGNLQSLCTTHHNIKTAKEDARRKSRK